MVEKITTFLKWTATSLFLGGAVMAATGSIPFNFYFILGGSLIWTTVGFIWKENSLIVLNAITAVLMVIAINNNEVAMNMMQMVGG